MVGPPAQPMAPCFGGLKPVQLDWMVVRCRGLWNEATTRIIIEGGGSGVAQLACQAVFSQTGSNTVCESRLVGTGPRVFYCAGARQWRKRQK